MNEQVAKLMGLIEYGQFYVITIRETGIDLQGKMSSDLIDYCKRKLGVDNFEISDTTCYLNGYNENFKITLT